MGYAYNYTDNAKTNKVVKCIYARYNKHAKIASILDNPKLV